MQAFRENPQPRDVYARIRTRLANERTLLAYLRTGIGFSAAGASALHFLSGPAAMGIGSACILFAMACLLFGMYRFLAARDSIDKVEDKPDADGGI